MSDVQLLQGDCVAILPTLECGSIQTVVTSPPYYGLRDYGLQPTHWPSVRFRLNEWSPELVVPAQAACLGLEDSPLDYVAHLIHVLRLVREVLADDGTVWLNLGDSYANDTKWGGASSGKHVTALHGASGIGRRRNATGIASKCLIGIPWMAAMALRADGWYLRSDIIWHKVNAMPESVLDRPTKDHEYLFLLTKQKRYYYNAAAIKEPAQLWSGSAATFCRTGGKGTQNLVPSQSVPQHRPNRSRGMQAYTHASLGSPQRDSKHGVGDPAPSRNRRTVWSVPTKGLSDAHYAPMPEALVVPCILAGSREGDTILDPFGGSGTVVCVGLRLFRRGISIDLNPEYIAIQKRRTEQMSLMESKTNLMKHIPEQNE